MYLLKKDDVVNSREPFMPVNPLSNAQLPLLAKQLHPFYSNSVSKKYIDLFCTLVQNNIDAARGMVIFACRELPQREFQRAMLTLQMPETFDLEQELIWLAKLSAVIKEKYQPEELPKIGWDKIDLEARIHGCIVEVLNSDDNYKKLLAATPDSTLLEMYIEGMPQEYKAMKEASWFSNSGRDLTFNFTSFINSQCKGQSKLEAFNIRIALLIFVGRYIEQEGWILSADGGLTYGSDLLRLCKKYLNIDDFSCLTLPYQASFFIKLSKFINSITYPGELNLFKQKLEEQIRAIERPQQGYFSYVTKASNVLFDSVGMHNYFSPQKKVYKTLTTFPCSNLNVEWVNALLQLSDDEVSAKEKQSIRVVVGIKPKELMTVKTFKMTTESGDSEHRERKTCQL